MIFEGFPWHYSIHFNWTANYTGNKTREVKCQDSYSTSMYHVSIAHFKNWSTMLYIVSEKHKVKGLNGPITMSHLHLFSKTWTLLFSKCTFFFHLFNAFRNEELKNRIFLLWTSNFWTQVKLQGTFPTILMAPSMWSLVTFCY